MTIGRGRARRPDDWPSSHVRARTDLSDRLDGSLDPGEATWLGVHLAACPDCQAIEADYASQRLELRALRDQAPPPPRDLWARTAAAIENESRFRDGSSRASRRSLRRTLAPTALLAAALVVAVALGTLTSSQRPVGDGDAGSSAQVAFGTASPVTASVSQAPGATRIPVSEQYAYLTRDPEGSFRINVGNVDGVCPEGASQPCGTDPLVESHPVAVDQQASAIFGTQDDSRLIVVNDPSATSGGTVSVVSNPDAAGPTPSPSPTPTPTPAVTASLAPATASVSPTTATASPPASSAPPTGSPAVTARPSIAVTPSPSGQVEIANDVILVGQSAAYSANGRWFAFTARPADGSAGPDIYLWRVGDARANAITADHRSIFGSWAADLLAGSTIVDAPRGQGAGARVDLVPGSFVIDPATHALTTLPQTGAAWRPAVDPTGRLAVYWSGTVRAASATTYAPDRGRLVIGDWVGANGPTASAAARSSVSAAPTAPTNDQSSARHETTIVGTTITDWDARWDSTGTHLAVWVADPVNPAIGKLSLYAVSSFDGKIDLKTPLLSPTVAAVGYAISDGKLVWAEPAPDGSSTGDTIQLLVWTDTGVGTVKTITGPAIIIR